MREISTKLVYEELKKAILSTLVETTDSAKCALHRAYDSETNSAAKYALDIILKNIDVAKEKRLPLCQDTGMAVVFIEIGGDVHFTGEFIGAEIDRAVADAYREGYFRMSVLDPITRKNTGDNTPAIVHYEYVRGDKVCVRFLPKGFGSENMTKTYMLNPSDSVEGIVRCVLEAVKTASSSPCPPVVVGVGIGGTLDKACEISKKALLREVGKPSNDEFLAKLESELLTKINALGIGAQGLGGISTALAVHMEKFPTHIAGLPVCVSLQCHSIRIGEFTL